MFCPKCGHTLSADAQNCANCGQAVGDSRFDGVPYTGEKPDIVLINHGANDRAACAEEYIQRYGCLLYTSFTKQAKSLRIYTRRKRSPRK